MRLRDYQQDIVDQVERSVDDVLIQLDTGAGKTPIIAALSKRAPTLVLAHRTILIVQASHHLARAGVGHHVIATRQTRAHCAPERQGSDVTLASLFSLASRLRRGFLVKLHWENIIIDEAHHVAPGNTWAAIRAAFPDARLIGLTATPCRLDGSPLGKPDGLFDRLIQAESLRAGSVATLIARGYLSDYRAYSIASEIDRAQLRMGAGDYTEASLRAAMRGKAIFGDALEHYRRLAEGRRALAVCIGIRNAEELSERARADGIASSVIHSELGASENARRLDAFRDGRIRLLANVDMLGEGFDLPDIDALILLRPTASFGRYRQWIGRALRPAPDKDAAIIIDHVGNIVRHGLPDEPVAWSIDQAPPQQRTNLIGCASCGRTFRAWLRACPECGAPAALDERRHIGGYYADQSIIDFSLCEAIRARIEAGQAQSEDLVVPAWYGSDLIGRTCKRVADWVAASLDAAGIERADINRYIKTLRRDDVIARYTLDDVKRNHASKALKEFRQWQRTASSTATRASTRLRRTSS